MDDLFPVSCPTGKKRSMNGRMKSGLLAVQVFLLYGRWVAYEQRNMMDVEASWGVPARI